MNSARKRPDEEQRTLERAASAGDAAAADAISASWVFSELEGSMFVADDDAIDKATARGLRVTMKLQKNDLVVVNKCKEKPKRGKQNPQQLHGITLLGYVMGQGDNDPDDDDDDSDEPTDYVDNEDTNVDVRVLAFDDGGRPANLKTTVVTVNVDEDEIIVLRRDGLPLRKPAK